MIIRTVAAVLILPLLAAAQTAPSATKPNPAKPEVSSAVTKAFAKALGNYGGWWSALSEEERDSFIDGYTGAMDRAGFLTDAFCQENRKALRPGRSFDEQLKAVATLCNLAGDFDFKFTPGSAPSEIRSGDQRLIALKPRLDKFYEDPLNGHIPAFAAMQYVRDEMNGKKTAGQLLDELNVWRKTRK